MDVVRNVGDLRAHVRKWRAKGETVALVPTMGALHEGHLSLIDIANTRCDRAVCSIFVNPTQFAPTEDFDAYPRTEEQDFALLEARKTDLVFAPDVANIYREGHSTRVEVDGLSRRLEGEFRPHFFSGVATVVMKLLNQTQPDAAIFGEKDYQQLCVIRRMVTDTDMPVDIIGAETVREPDGLAMASRNRYLTESERAVAPVLHQMLQSVAARVKSGEAPETAARDATRTLLESGFREVDYIAVRDAETLAEPRPGKPMRALGAAWLGKARLIDNIPV